MSTADHDLVAACLRGEVVNCGVCGQPFAGSHRYAIVASAVADDLPTLEASLEAIGARDWGTLRNFNEWRGTSDNVIVCFVPCAEAGGMVIRVFDPLELYANPSVLGVELLSKKDASELLPLLAGQSYKRL